MIRILARDPAAHDTAFEILEDGQRYVSLQLWDATGDNALVGRRCGLLIGEDVKG